MIKIQIDGIHYEADAGKNLLETCIALGLNLPYFCYHPALGSVGACRQCAVKRFANADDKTGKMVMSCMEPVTDGMIISIDDPDAKSFRASVVEGLMTNHPHDCPVCDEGGECHLQDMTVMTGHNYRRFDFKKRTYLNQNLGPFIHHEMNRCIQCYRCVRFYRDYAGGKDLNVFGSANHVFFGREKDGILESEFSGNLVEVCPTGVFTDKTFKQHFARKWDLTNAPSVCAHCSLGCNTLVGERYGSIRRVMSRYNGDINGYFLCDRGRFGYEFNQHPSRIRKIMKKNDEQGLLPMADDLTLLDELRTSLMKTNTIGISSSRASLESNYALLKMVGEENFYHGITRLEQLLTNQALELLNSDIVRPLSLRETENCDTVFILGEDVTQTAPLLALALRQAVRNKSLAVADKMGIPEWNDAAAREVAQDIKTPLFISHPFTTKLEDVATESWHATPSEIARLGFAVAHAINSEAPIYSQPDKQMEARAERIARALMQAANPVIVTGINGGTSDILNSITNIAIALAAKGGKPGIAIAFPESNSVGLGMMQGGSLDDALDRINANTVDNLIVVENDLYRRISKNKVDTALEKCNKIIVMDHLMHATAEKANILLPAATTAESSGTIVNNEGRTQRYYPALSQDQVVKESWNWIIDLIRMAGKDQQISWSNFDDIVAALAYSAPVFSAIIKHLPNAGYRVYNEKIARQTMRFSGRTAINSATEVSEPGPPVDLDSPLNFSMEGYKGNPPADLIPYYWSPGWNSPQAINKYLDEPNGNVRNLDPGLKLFSGKVRTKAYINSIPDPFNPDNDNLFFVPVFLIFGSEELSSNAQTIGERIPKPYVLLNENAYEKLLSGKPANGFEVVFDQTRINVLVKPDPGIPDGVAGISYLPQDMPLVDLPGWGKIVVRTKIE